MIQKAIQLIMEQKDISNIMAMEVMDEIMSGNASPVHIGAYLTALHMKGETIDEISGSALEMKRHSTHFDIEKDIFEIVGTGGDMANTFNISTTTSILVSSAGIPVAKHGNRGVSSKSGAADVLEALGVNINMETETCARLLDEINLCFMFAQKYHPAMRYVAPVRKELGVRTIFNILGPLTNPAGANLQLLGVYKEDLVEQMAEVLMKIGVKRGMVVYGKDGMDEISLSAPTIVCEFTKDTKRVYEITPEMFGLKRCKKAELEGGDPKENAQITMDILSGVKGAKTDAVLLNAAASFHIVNESISMLEGIELARKMIESKKALEQLQRFIQQSNEVRDYDLR